MGRTLGFRARDAVMVAQRAGMSGYLAESDAMLA